MKLGVVTTSYPRTPGDPAGSFVAAHVEALRALGHDVEVIAAGGPGPVSGGADTRSHVAAAGAPASGAADTRSSVPLTWSRRRCSITAARQIGSSATPLARSPRPR